MSALVLEKSQFFVFSRFPLKKHTSDRKSHLDPNHRESLGDNSSGKLLFFSQKSTAEHQQNNITTPVLARLFVSGQSAMEEIILINIRYSTLTVAGQRKEKNNVRERRRKIVVICTVRWKKNKRDLGYTVNHRKRINLSGNYINKTIDIKRLKGENDMEEKKCIQNPSKK